MATCSLNATRLNFTTDGSTIAARMTASADTFTLVGDASANVVMAGIATPTANNHAASKAYVDNLHNGLSWKDSVRVATTTSGTLASDFENGDTVDGVTLATGDRILIKNQATGSENGIYTVNASGAPTRAVDMATDSSAAGAAAFAAEGTTNGDSAWVCTNAMASDTVGTDDLSFTQFATGANPGGADTQLQWNDNGSFGGVTGWSTNGTTNLTAADNSALQIGAGADFSLSHDGTNTTATSATGNFLLDNTNATGSSIFRLGTDDANTTFQVENDSASALLTVNGAGLTTVTDRITGVSDATGDSDAVNYDQFRGATWKERVICATTANVDLTADLQNGDTIDGVTLATGDRVLVKNQSTASQNGIYVAVASGTASRSDDLATNDDASGIAVVVNQGTSNGDSLFFCTSDEGSAVVGTDTLTFSEISGSGGTPGGSTTQIQYNNAGSFGGLSTFTSDGTNLTLNGGDLSVGDTDAINIGDGNDLILTHDATDSTITSATGDLVIDNTNATGSTIFRCGTDTSATDFQVQNDSASALFTIDGAGAVDVAGSLNVGGELTLDADAASGTPGKEGSVLDINGQTFTDNNTAGSGTATAHVFQGIAAPTLAATNASVTTTDAATLYVAGAPSAGTNQTITNAWSLWCEAGDANFGADVYANQFNTTSDANLKNNIRQLGNPLQKLEGINGYQYKWKATYSANSDLQWGVVAQQLEEAGMGHLVAQKGEYKTVNYQGLIPLLIESIKELNTKVDNLSS